MTDAEIDRLVSAVTRGVECARLRARAAELEAALGSVKTWLELNGQHDSALYNPMCAVLANKETL